MQERSAAAIIKRPAVRRLLPQLLAIWRDRQQWPTAAARAQAINDVLREAGQDELGSHWTIRRLRPFK